MIKWVGTLLLLLWLPSIATAETAIFEVNYLPLQEAESIVKSRLSPFGSVASLPSRRMLLVSDDARHIEQARALLQRLDVAAEQYAITVELIFLNDHQARSISTDARLPGGWIRIRLSQSQQQISVRQQLSLRLTSSRQGNIQSGIIQPSRQHTRQWLAGYGIINIHSVELIPITTGFYATVRPAGKGMVNVQIVPWMRQQKSDSSGQGNAEVLVDMGTQQAAPVRLNSTPVTRQNQIIEMAGAATEVTIAVGEAVTIAANDEEAELLGDALLSGGSSADKKSFAIRLRVEQR